MDKSKLIPLLESLGVIKLWRYRNRHCPIILMYHRIVDDLMLPGIKPVIFKQQMEYLKTHFNIVSMDQLHQDLIQNKVKPYSVAVTFDDGHQDFYQTAWPILRALEIPTTLFIPINFIDKRNFLWPDLIRYLILNSPRQNVFVFDKNFSLSTLENRLFLWHSVGNYCLNLSPKEQDITIKNLAKELDVLIPIKPMFPFCPVSWSELKEMQQQGLHIGSHSVSHPILSLLTEHEITQELLDSSQRIEAMLGVKPSAFCYPNGMPSDISTTARQSAKNHYQYAVTAFPNNLKKVDPHYYGRYAAPTTLNGFKKLVNGLQRSSTRKGNYS